MKVDRKRHWRLASDAAVHVTVNAVPALFLAAMLVFLVACSRGEDHHDDDLLSAQQLASDLKYVSSVIESAHPNPFFHEPRQRFEAAITAIQDAAPHGASDEWLYQHLAPAIAMLGDSHTNLDPYTKAYQEFRNANGRLFPLELRIVNRRIIVIANYGPERTIPAGAELGSINGLPSGVFVDRIGRFIGAERSTLRDSRVAEDVRAYMWHAGMTAPFLVKYYRPDRKMARAHLAGATIASLRAWDNSSAGQLAQTPFRICYARAGAVGVLTVRSFDNPVGWPAFTTHLVENLKSHGARSLLIDVRLNSGGGTDTSDMLLRVLAHRRFRDFSAVETKVSGPTKISYGRREYAGIYGSKAWSSPNGTLLREVGGGWEKPVLASSAFPGTVFVLVGSGTFSTAAIFAAAAQDSNTATILGQESGGLATLYGEAFGFTLPVSNLEASVSTKFFVRPNGDRAPRGVVPDHALTESAQDAPNDPELDEAISYAFSHTPTVWP